MVTAVAFTNALSTTEDAPEDGSADRKGLVLEEALQPIGIPAGKLLRMGSLLLLLLLLSLTNSRLLGFSFVEGLLETVVLVDLPAIAAVKVLPFAEDEENCLLPSCPCLNKEEGERR